MPTRLSAAVDPEHERLNLVAGLLRVYLDRHRLGALFREVESRARIEG